VRPLHVRWGGIPVPIQARSAIAGIVFDATPPVTPIPRLAPGACMIGTRPKRERGVIPHGVSSRLIQTLRNRVGLP
jgi:hypothetical protein